MNEIYQSSPDMRELEIEEDLKGLEGSIKSGSMESLKKGIEKKYPPIDSFGGVKLSKTETYSNIPGNPVRLKRTARRCGTNPTYENSLVITQSGREQNITHNETYYTCQDKYFSVDNIEWRIRSILNKDRERQNLPRIPENQKVRNNGDDGTIRDMNGYIVIAADLKKFPRGSLIMTTLGPGRVYDVGSKIKGNHIDVFTSWPV